MENILFLREKGSSFIGQGKIFLCLKVIIRYLKVDNLYGLKCCDFIQEL